MDVCAALHKHPTSFAKKLKDLRDKDRLKHNVHYLHTSESPKSQILWDLEALTLFFKENQPKRES